VYVAIPAVAPDAETLFPHRRLLSHGLVNGAAHGDEQALAQHLEQVEAGLAGGAGWRVGGGASHDELLLPGDLIDCAAILTKQGSKSKLPIGIAAEGEGHAVTSSVPDAGTCPVLSAQPLP
jgi:hypothetical protein